ncbi:MAG: hypothetical protein CR977_00825 [Gammaproteobacteria bacterium]|nr:MAG: hypothetical protein CR977_00825 [Gammaproteobacteria bacterium]
MSNFTDNLTRFYGKTQRATATIIAVQANGYSASTTTGGQAILLTSTADSYAVGDVVYYDVITREISGKSSVTSWTDLPV